MEKSITEMKKYICINAMELCKENRLAVLQLLKESIDNNLIKESSDGSRINLNKIDNIVITRLHTLIEHKIKEE